MYIFLVVSATKCDYVDQGKHCRLRFKLSYIYQMMRSANVEGSVRLSSSELSEPSRSSGDRRVQDPTNLQIATLAATSSIGSHISDGSQTHCIWQCHLPLLFSICSKMTLCQEIYSERCHLDESSLNLLEIHSISTLSLKSCSLLIASSFSISLAGTTLSARLHFVTPLKFTSTTPLAPSKALDILHIIPILFPFLLFLYHLSIIESETIIILSKLLYDLNH